MPQYFYRAMDATGRIEPGNMDAANEPDLEMRLGRMGLDLIDCRVSRAKVIAIKRVITRKDLINFCFHMEQMTGAGVPILEGLNDLRESIDHPRFREMITGLIENIEGGKQLSAAMAAYPEVFDLTFTSLITAGEQSGKLAEVFRNLSETLKWQDELASQTKKIIMYPAAVGLFVTGVMFFLMIYLVPQLTSFVKNMGNTLPLHTKALIFVSNIFINYWYVMIAVPVIGFFAARTWLARSEHARYMADGFKLRIWMIGPVLHKIILARFATFFAMMYASGITILECIRLSEGIVGNRVVAAGLRRAAQQISEGQGITQAFQNTGIFPPLVIRMLKVGESTGALDGALHNVSYFYNREVKEMIEKVQSMIEPAITVVLGVMVGWIMLSVMGPIYDTISKIRT
jgi:type IV pilus assembly protein PilC